MSYWEIIQTLIILGLGYWNLRLQGRVTRIDEARRGDELRRQQSAFVSAHFTPRGDGGRFFVLVNSGQGDARDVDWQMIALGEGEPPIVRREGHTLPIPRLAAGASYPFVATFMGSGMASDVEARVTWRDDLGDQERTISLSTL